MIVWVLIIVSVLLFYLFEIVSIIGLGFLVFFIDVMILLVDVGFLFGGIGIFMIEVFGVEFFEGDVILFGEGDILIFIVEVEVEGIFFFEFGLVSNLIDILFGYDLIMGLGEVVIEFMYDVLLFMGIDDLSFGIFGVVFVLIIFENVIEFLVFGEMEIFLDSLLGDDVDFDEDLGIFFVMFFLEFDGFLIFFDNLVIVDVLGSFLVVLEFLMFVVWLLIVGVVVGVSFLCVCCCMLFF